VEEGFALTKNTKITKEKRDRLCALRGLCESDAFFAHFKPALYIDDGEPSPEQIEAAQRLPDEIE